MIIADNLNAPPTSRTDMSVGDYVLLGNDILMQWYSTLNNREPVPLTPTNMITTRQVQETSTLLIIGAIIVAAVIFSRK